MSILNPILHTLEKTYRFISALTLILFVGNILLPIGLSAASVYCNMTMTNNLSLCCRTVSMDSHHENKNELQDCNQQVFCEQAISSNQTDNPAITESCKIVIVAELSKELLTIKKNSDRPPTIKNEPASFHYPPPIFLLNSTFLN